jgi:hypothetical protein
LGTVEQSLTVGLLVVIAVFIFGLKTTLLGPYSDPLHLVILSGVLFTTYLVFSFVVLWRGRPPP